LIESSQQPFKTLHSSFPARFLFDLKVTKAFLLLPHQRDFCSALSTALLE